MTNKTEILRKLAIYCFSLYTFLTIIIIIMIKIQKISYGPDLQDSLLPIIFFIVWFFSLLFFFISSVSKGLISNILKVIIVLFTISMMSYYFLENGLTFH